MLSSSCFLEIPSFLAFSISAQMAGSWFSPSPSWITSKKSAMGSALQAQGPPATISGQRSSQDLCANTGYEELSLSSLSTSDHGQLEELLDDLNEWAPKEHVSLSLPSLRVDNFSQSLIEKTTKVRKSGLTFAAEAGTQRLRDVINKNVTWDQIAPARWWRCRDS